MKKKKRKKNKISIAKNLEVNSVFIYNYAYVYHCGEWYIYKPKAVEESILSSACPVASFSFLKGICFILSFVCVCIVLNGGTHGGRMVLYTLELELLVQVPSESRRGVRVTVTRL